MTLQYKIITDLGIAIANKDTATKEMLKVLVAEMSREESKELTDDEVLYIVRKQVASAEKCNTLHEIPILEKYLPKMMNESGTRVAVKKIIDDNGFATIKDMGKVMVELKKHPNSNLIDNKIASVIVKELLM